MGNCNCCSATQQDNLNEASGEDTLKYLRTREETEPSAVSIQSHFRGYRVRRQLTSSLIGFQETDDPEIILHHGPPAELAVQQSKAPKIKNKTVLGILTELPPFFYDDDLPGDERLPYFPPFNRCSSEVAIFSLT